MLTSNHGSHDLFGTPIHVNPIHKSLTQQVPFAISVTQAALSTSL